MLPRLKKLWSRFFPKKKEPEIQRQQPLSALDLDHAEGIAWAITEFVYMTHAKIGAFRDPDFPHWIKSVRNEYFKEINQIIIDNFRLFSSKTEQLVEIQMKVNSMHNAEPVYMVLVASYQRIGISTDVLPKLSVTIISEEEFRLYKAGLSKCPVWPESCHVIYKEVDLLYDFAQKMVEFTQNNPNSIF